MEQNAQPAEGQARPEVRTRPRRNSRRKALTTGLGVAAATVGAGALLELSSGTASASSMKPGVFASSVAGTPAVTATGTNGAGGMDASSNMAGAPAIKATGTNGADGVDARSDGIAVLGDATNATTGVGSGTGVQGQSDTSFGVVGTSKGGTGVFGRSTGSTGVGGFSSAGGFGVSGHTDSGTGVIGFTGSNYGVVGFSNDGVGVGGLSQASNSIGIQAGSVDGIAIFADSANNICVQAHSGASTGVEGTSVEGDGVFGQTDNGGAAGVHGKNTNPNAGVPGLAGLFEGNVAVKKFGSFNGDLTVDGNLKVFGTKSFVQAHPTDPTKEIVYVAPEGGEAGTYVRGTGQLQSGKAVIALPEHFGLVTAYEDLTIQLTSRGEWLQLYLVELDPTQAVVREAQGKSGAFDYLIHGVRRGYEQHEVLRTKR